MRRLAAISLLAWTCCSGLLGCPPKFPARPSGPWLPPPPLYALDSVGPGVKAQPASMNPKLMDERNTIDRITAPFRDEEREGIWKPSHRDSANRS